MFADLDKIPTRERLYWSVLPNAGKGDRKNAVPWATDDYYFQPRMLT
jgi:hypothetical protein